VVVGSEPVETIPDVSRLTDGEVDAEFAALILADDDLVRAEFESLVADAFTPAPPRTPRPEHFDAGWPAPDAAGSWDAADGPATRTRRRDVHPRNRQRSPPLGVEQS
jgi:hypothetical protein